MHNKNFDKAILIFEEAQEIFAENFGEMAEEYLMHASDLILALSLSGNHQQALELANKAKIGESETVYAAVIGLSIMSAKVASRHTIDKASANQLYARVKTQWPANIFQFKFASSAADFIGLTQKSL